MAMLYHLVPRGMRGNTLFPLNELARIHPDLAAAQRKKYEPDRLALLAFRVHPFGVLWNDVLHLSAIHPRDISAALVAAGIPAPMPRQFYVFDPHMLNPLRMTVFIRRKGNAPAPEDFSSFDPSDLARFKVVPAGTIAYFERCARAGVRPFLWHGTPHFFHCGPIVIANAEIITV